MANCILAFPDYVAADPRFATVGFTYSQLSTAGDIGSWTPELPLTNLLRPELAYVARSTDAALSSTQLVIDLGAVRFARGLFIPYTNGSRTCKYRVTAMLFFEPNLTEITFQSDWTDLYAAVYDLDSLYWGHPSLWDGKLSAEEAVYYRIPIVEVFPSIIQARYWMIEFDDTDNEDGYIEIPKVVIAGGWEPSLQIVPGASLAIEDPTLVQNALGGAVYFDQRPKKRVQRFTIQNMRQDEVLAWVNDMQQRLGVHGTLFFVHDPADRQNMHRRSFLARMRSLPPLEYLVSILTNVSFELEEVVA